MAIQIQSVKNYTPTNSVTTPGLDSSQVTDQTNPYSYVEWLERIQTQTNNSEDLTLQYNKYLIKWSEYQGLSQARTDRLIVERYKQLLRNIALNYTTSEEKRFLSNIDYNNFHHVESAIPFFASKIKQISLYVANQREQIKQQKLTYSNLGSLDGVSRDLSNQILNQLDNPAIKPTYTRTRGETKFHVTLEEQYDYSKEYFKHIIPVTSGDVFLSDAQIVQQVLEQCKPQLVLATDITILLDGETTVDQDVQNLAPSEFYNYQQSTSTLNKLKHDEYARKYLGSAVMSVSSGEVNVLTNPEAPWRNMLNRGSVYVNDRQHHDDMRTVDQIGGLFVPKNMGLLTFFSLSPTLSITDTQISVDSMQDVRIHGNSVWNKTTSNPVDHEENVMWIKADASNPGLHGDIVDDSQLAKFTGYRSFEDVNNTPSQGVSRSTDTLDFFKGDRGSTWHNSDVFKPLTVNLFDIDTRQDTLIVGHDTLYQWRSDIYGNEYALYKSIRPPRSPLGKPPGYEDPYESSIGCDTIDGGDTLATLDPLYTEGVEYDFFDGGRKGGSDPKTEQFTIPRAFPDIRRIVEFDSTGSPVKEPWNTFYYGIDPSTRTGDVGYYPVTFHGFARNISYDRQAYGGLFTDTICGVIRPGDFDCEIADNYSFGVYTEQVSGLTLYQSRDFADTENPDAFEQYLNPIVGDGSFDADIGFSSYGFTSAVEVITRPDIDGQLFTDDFCEAVPGDYEHDVEDYPLYLDTLSVAETKFADEPAGGSDMIPTLYQQRTNTIGDVYFRSYNGQSQTKLINVMQAITNNFENFNSQRHSMLISALHEGRVLNMDVIYDKLLIETDTLLYITNINFDAESSQLLPANTTDVLIETSRDGNTLETSLGWFYNEHTHELITGHTMTFTVKQADRAEEESLDQINDRWMDIDKEWSSFYLGHEHDTTCAYPVIYTVDMNTLEFVQSSPNVDYVNQTKENYILTGAISAMSFEKIDRPVISYDTKTNMYNVSYSAMLSSVDDTTVFATFSNDYRPGQYNLKLIDSHAFHADETPRYIPPGPVWQQQAVDSKTIRLRPDQELIPNKNNPHVTKTESLSAMIGYPLSGLEFDLEIVNKTIPVDPDGFKLNKIVFDPGDGSAHQVRDRELDDGFRAPAFDITELPDQSDLGDPRRVSFKHKYMLTNSSPGVISASVSAIYVDFTTLTYDIKIETTPYTVDSGLGGMKLIESKIYTRENQHKQQLVYETQHPRYVTTIEVDR